MTRLARWMRPAFMLPFLWPLTSSVAHGSEESATANTGAERVPVTIYEFRSMLPSLSASSATDMFTTALVKTGRFRVVERQRMNEGVVREKQLQQSGWADGDASKQPLRGAKYVLEGTVSEANVAERAQSGGVNVAGMQVGGGASHDSIAIDVRVVDVANGDVLDAVAVRKQVTATSSGVSGFGNLLGTVLSRQGRDTTYVPEVQAQTQKRGGIDSALRAAIDDAVMQLAQRFAP